MDSKALTSKLVTDLGADTAKVVSLTGALADALAEIATELDSAAVPGFGSFVSEKAEEHIYTDPVTGKRTLVPPVIRMGFQPSVVLRKKIEKATRQ